jgi:hypothetical protein
MTLGDYVFYLIFRETSTEDTIGASLEKQRLIPIVMFNIVEEFFLFVGNSSLVEAPQLLSS